MARIKLNISVNLPDLDRKEALEALAKAVNDTLDLDIDDAMTELLDAVDEALSGEDDEADEDEGE